MFNINVNTAESWENHRNYPKEKHVAKIINFLGYNPFPKGETLGERLFYFRMVKGLSRVEVGNMIGVDDMTIIRWEKGVCEPRQKHHKPIEDLLTELNEDDDS